MLQERIVFNLLGIDDEARVIMTDAFGINLLNIPHISGQTSLIAIGFATVTLIVASGLYALLVSSNAPLKLLREYR